MKLFKSIILCGATVAEMSMTSCDDWLDVNVNPDTPSAESTAYHQRLAHIEFYTNSAQAFAGWRNVFACGDWTRYYGGGTYQNMSYWYPTSSIVTTPYQWWFVGAMANVDDMYKKALADDNGAYAGVALIIKSYGMMLMTDLYGEMPYEEACNPNTAIPKYDTGKTIYLGCLKDLDEGIRLLEDYKGKDHPGTQPTLAEGDFYCNGSVDKWIKLGYLLKARWCVKLSKKEAGSYLEGKYDADAILAALDKAQQSNADNAIVNHTDDNGKTHDNLGWNEPVDYSPLYSVSGMNYGYYVTKMLYDNLTNFDGKGIEDPRADHVIPWACSVKSASTPAEVKWHNQWRRSLPIDMASDIHSQSRPMHSNYGLDAKYETSLKGWWVNNVDAYADTLYVEQTSESKGYAAMPELFYRADGVSDGSRTSGTFYTRVSSPSYVGTYAEACFIRAEVLFNKGDKGGAFEAYKKGVRASIEQMNEKLQVWCNEDDKLKDCPSFIPMAQADIDNYVNNALGSSGDITLAKIMVQKRLALMFHMEIWNDMRRYDYDPSIFTGWSIPAYHFKSTAALKAIPEGKQFRRWRQCSHEINYNAENLQAIGSEVPGANLSYPGGWNQADDVWTINVWWDSDQK